MRGRKAAEIEGIKQYDFDKLAKTEGSPRDKEKIAGICPSPRGENTHRNGSFCTREGQIFNEVGQEI